MPKKQVRSRAIHCASYIHRAFQMPKKQVRSRAIHCASYIHKGFSNA